MKARNLYIIVFFLCLLKSHSQNNNQWVPGTICLNCPSSINAPKFNTAQVANGNNTLVTTYTQTACGLNFTHASVPLFKRNFAALGSTVSALQPAPFIISGIPPCGYVLKAFLYSDASGGNLPVTVSVTNSSSSVTATYTMTNIGSCADKCWGYGGSQSYRADVTSLVSGNGTYSITGFPVMPQSPSYDTDGATLFVIYADPTQNWTGSIVIADGCMGISGTVNSVISGFSVCANSTVTTGFGLIGDLQRIANTNFRFNSTTNNFVKAQASDKVWDFVVGAAANASISQTSGNFGVSTTGDCYNFVMTGMHYQTNCLTCGGGSSSSITPVTSNSANICAGSSATLIASPPANYTWNPGAIVGTSIVVTPNVTTYYSASIFNSSGCGFATSPVIVNPAPILTLTPGPATVCPGLTSLINCSGANTYTLFPGAIAGNPIAVNPTIATVYTVAGTSTTGCSNTNTVSVKVYTVAPVVPSYTSPLCAGGTLSLSVSSASSYTWNGPGGYINYFQNVTVTNATYSNSGIYTVSVFDSHGCLNSNTLNVVVNPQQPVTPTVTPFGPICNTTPPFNLNVTPSGGGWSGNPAVNPTGLVTPSFAVNGTTTAVYTVYVGPCLNSTTINIDASTFNSAALTGSVPNLCVTDVFFNLMNIVQSAASGTWTGFGVVGNYS
ncbi:MAG: hypothetical protein IT236_16515, partial [Bacteroidia bacterium]|nr:hypothetical protein [Bacteroidia bacterium]